MTCLGDRRRGMSRASRLVEYSKRQGLVCADAASHSRKADSFGESARACGETR
jgi:hypothetical protein